MRDGADLPALVAGVQQGLLTYEVDGDELEGVTPDALTPGAGTALLDAVLGVARAAGCRRAWLVTSNDNVAALRFYQRRGWRLVAVHLGALDTARALKPSIPRLGVDDIPVRDELDLAIDLGR